MEKNYDLALELPQNMIVRKVTKPTLCSEYQQSSFIAI